jgi:hypothetical protein
MLIIMNLLVEINPKKKKEASGPDVRTVPQHHMVHAARLVVNYCPNTSNSTNLYIEIFAWLKVHYLHGKGY